MCEGTHNSPELKLRQKINTQDPGGCHKLPFLRVVFVRNKYREFQHPTPHPRPLPPHTPPHKYSKIVDGLLHLKPFPNHRAMAQRGLNRKAEVKKAEPLLTSFL